MHVHKDSFYKVILLSEISKLRQIVPSPKQALNKYYWILSLWFKEMERLQFGNYGS
jgi:hypothetical protein